MRRALAHVDLRIQTLIQLRQRFGESEAVAVEQILMLLVLLSQYVQQRGVGFTHVDVQSYAVNLAERYALQALVQLADTVLLALNRLADNIRHAAGADCQLLLAGSQLFRQTAQLDLHLFDGFDRIVGTDDVLADTLAQVLIDRHKELNFALRAFRIFRHAQDIAQVFVIRHRQTQRAERLIRHRAQLISGKIGQLAAVQTTFNPVVFHHSHHGTPARFGGNHLLALLVVVAFQLAQTTGQVIHLRFAEGQRFFQLVAARAVVAELGMQFVATNTRPLLCAAIGTYADILQLFVQVGQQLFLGIKGAFQRRQHLAVLAQLRGMATHRFTGAGTFRFCLLQTLTQFLVQIAVAVQHFRRVGVAEVRPTLGHFGQGKGLLTGFALNLLRPGIIFFQLFELLRVALQDGEHRFQLRQLIAVLLHEARGFLCFVETLLDLIHPIGKGVIRQQVQTRQNTVQGSNTLFGLLELDAALLVVVLVGGQRAFKLGTTGGELADLRFRIGFKGDGQMTTDKAAERLVQTLGFLHIERERGKAFGERLALGVQTFNAAFTRGTAKQRQRREARITPLAVGDFHYHRFFQLVDAKDAVIERLRIPFDQIEIFRAIFQPFKLVSNQGEIRHHDSVAGRAIQRRVVRRIFEADVVVDFGQQHAAKTLCQGVQARVFCTARLA